MAALLAAVPAVGAAEFWDALQWVAAFFAVVIALTLAVPAFEFEGYVLDRAGQRLRYRLNGFRVHLLLAAAAYWLVRNGHLDGTYLARHTWAAFLASNVLGLGGTLAALLPGWLWPETIERAYVAPTVGRPKPVPDAAVAHVPPSTRGSGRGLLYDIYAGFQFNPRVGPVDVKMFLYLYGALLTHAIAASCVYTSYLEHGAITPSVAATAGLLSYFLLEYNFHEHVHTYTYDLFAEKIGFKLIWGCIVFYPFFYTLGLHPLVATATSVTPSVAAACGGIFLLGYTLSRGANNQKFAYRVDPARPFLFGLVPQRAVPNSRLLCSGWWALARHINYFGEILMALGIALPAALATGSWLPLTYPLYYVALLVPRALEDGRICAAKYGAAWAEYCRRVPYLIIPGVL